MADTLSPAGHTLPPQRPGEKLRDARLALGLDIAEVAARTRIPVRHLEAIEAGDYSQLPSPTYATGFTKASARALGLNEAEMAREVREELAQRWDREPTVQTYDVSEPARGPSGGIVWGGLVAAVVLLVAIGIWFGTDLLRGGPGSSPTTTQDPVPLPASVPTAVATSATGGQVSLTANDEVWVRIYDAKDTTLFMKTMAPGERYDVPPNADKPMINIGRPDKLSITVNGSAVAPLGDGRVAMKDVPIDGATLTARNSEGGAPTAASPTPVTRAARRESPARARRGAAPAPASQPATTGSSASPDASTSSSNVSTAP